MTVDIQKNLHAVLQKMTDAAKRSGRDPKEIRLVAVSKAKPAEAIEEAQKAGLKIFGENYVQEFLGKYRRLLPFQIQWHFVGHLQRRKVKEVVGKAVLIHSLDSYPLAHEVEKRAGEKNSVQKCLLEINIAGEGTKTGIAPDEAASLLREISLLPHLEVTGLMGLPPPFDDPEKSRPFFVELRELLKEINVHKGYRKELTELSMGMSHDFEVAIEEGATYIRVGTALFGERVK
ncbi:MAG: YggS family pyridoxal phosphate-dependent enzyme [Deltaproteobacteria bacterium]|nr:YggS family pyridoxal phosphate-dependent enzyme [Deltaproteobacteria bacterium]